MGIVLSAVPKTPNINLTKYVNIGDNQWRFCPVVIASNGNLGKIAEQYDRYYAKVPKGKKPHDLGIGRPGFSEIERNIDAEAVQA